MNIYKKVNNKYIVWFERSNQWIQLEEPAWFIYQLYIKKNSIQSISNQFANKYNISEHDCLEFVNEIYDRVSDMSNSTHYIKKTITSVPFNNTIIPYSRRYYLIRDKIIVISYGSRTAEYYIHAPLAHLEIQYCEKVDSFFEIFEYNKVPHLRQKEESGTVQAYENYNHLKKGLFISILNIMYQKNSDEWMAYIHASALSDGKQSLILSSVSGSGKSTMAALLQAKGLYTVADDFVPIDLETKCAYPFPAAISVKEGSFTLLSSYYDNLQERSFNKYEYTHSSVRYISPEQDLLNTSRILPVKNIVFICYNPKISCDFIQLDTNDALKLFHEQAWVSPSPNNIKEFIDWFVGVNCYKLEYGDTNRGMEKVLSLFSKQ